MKHLLTRLTAAAFLLCGCASLAASKQPLEYQVELVIYSHLNPTGIAAEHWPGITDDPASNNKKMITLEPASESALESYPTQSYLPEDAWKLTQDAQRIEKNLHATILYHQAWRINRQELLKNPMRFKITDQVINDFNSEDEALPNQTTGKLLGSLYIRLTRYFNTRLQLTLSEPSSKIKPYLRHRVDPCGASDICYFTFDVRRRTRSSTLNYLDHPLYGVLMEITPAEKPQPAAL
jgi:hypothetical protein